MATARPDRRIFLSAFLISVFLSACVAPGGGPGAGSTDPAAGVPGGGAFGATGEKTVADGGVDGSGGEEPGFDEGSGAYPAGSKTSNPKSNGADGFTFKPLPGGLPAPTDDFPTHPAFFKGKGEVCQATEDRLVFRLEGFVRKCMEPCLGPSSVKNFDNNYVLVVFNKMLGETVEAPLQSKVTAVGPGSASPKKIVDMEKLQMVEKTGFVTIAFRILPSQYEDIISSGVTLRLRDMRDASAPLSHVALMPSFVAMDYVENVDDLPECAKFILKDFKDVLGPAKTMVPVPASD